MTEVSADDSADAQGRTLLVAIGNSLRRDDGVAAAVLTALGELPHCEPLWVHQLTIDLAERLAEVSRVVFIDADERVDQPLIEAVSSAPLADEHQGASWVFSHGLSPADLVALASSLYGRHVEAWLCRVPARDFGAGEGFSALSAATVAPTAAALRRFLGGDGADGRTTSCCLARSGFNPEMDSIDESS